MNHHDYVIITVLNEVKNITKASRKLHISQPALTKRVKKIERELDATIMIRSKHGIEFTPIGDELVRFSKRMIDEMKEFRDTINSMANTVKGTLRIGVSTLYAHYILPSIIQGYRDQYPDVNFSVTSNRSIDIFNLLKTKKIPLAILRIDKDWLGEKILLFDEPVCLVNNQGIDIDDLASVPFISFDTSPELQDEIDNWLFENNIHLSDNTIKVSSITTCLELVKESIGWSIIPSAALRDYDGHWQALKWSDGSPFSRKTFLYSYKDSLQLNTIASFVEYICDIHNSKK